MYIRKVTITNFKSYKAETIVDNLSPRMNLLLGDNGSGKTNLLEAIMFVLDFPKKMLVPARNLMVYDSDKPGSVEIIFGNKRKGLQFDGKHVSSLKREISLRSDKGFINNKQATREAFRTVLHALGVASSICGHFYIKQEMGLIMTTISDAERLQLLLHAIGISNEKKYRDASQAVTKEEEDAMMDIRLSFTDIKKRIKTLEKGTKLAKKYQVLNYLFYSLSLQKNTMKLTKLDAEKTNLKRELPRLKQELHKAIEEERKALRRFKDHQMKFQTLDKESETLSKKFESYSNAKVSLSFEVGDLTDRVPQSIQVEEETKEELESVNESIKQTRDQLEVAESTLEEIKLEIKVVNQMWSEKSNELIVKRRLLNGFASKDERDKEIASRLKSNKDRMNALMKDQELEKDPQICAANVESLIAERDGQIVTMVQLRDAVLARKEEVLRITVLKDQQESKISVLRKKIDEHEYKLASLREELNWIDEEYRKIAEKDAGKEQKIVTDDIFEGQKSVQIVLNEWKSRGGKFANRATSYHGMVIDSFHCDPQFNAPVCVAAGKNKFCVLKEPLDMNGLTWDVLQSLDKSIPFWKALKTSDPEIDQIARVAPVTNK